MKKVVINLLACTSLCAAPKKAPIVVIGDAKQITVGFAEPTERSASPASPASPALERVPSPLTLGLQKSPELPVLGGAALRRTRAIAHNLSKLNTVPANPQTSAAPVNSTSKSNSLEDEEPGSNEAMKTTKPTREFGSSEPSARTTPTIQAAPTDSGRTRLQRP